MFESHPTNPFDFAPTICQGCGKVIESGKDTHIQVAYFISDEFGDMILNFDSIACREEYEDRPQHQVCPLPEGRIVKFEKASN